ncbi:MULTISPECIES: hypothetical protein [Rhizobium]|uniref:Uncharacterized protein n=1 Tax=Rhizobium wuzhouense TaxID=1986026 RepID=A0ABX5P021_9HYPH|nr:MULTISPECIES: hypothetical protein [Rhizobium]PYB76948.1 hypothetical protein DMY87_00705 [Rhizobium wuzhouense]RKE85588.1 hypothetical protein DFO46_2389 [Rhizobium sp. AG855]
MSRLPLYALLLASVFSAPAYAEEDTLPDHASPSICVVIIGLALENGAIDAADEEDYKAAAETFREKSAELNGGKDGANQMIGSSVAFYDALSKADLEKGADMCLSAEDESFDADE